MTVSVIGVLSAVLLPALSGVRASARVATCAMQLHQIGVALGGYTAEARHLLPPFIFSEMTNPSLPLSGHYGGGDTFNLYRQDNRDVNLHALRRERMIDEAQLLCPGAPKAVREQQAGYFAQGRFSTYCLRMPFSYDIWPGQTPPRGDWDALDVYRFAAGGQILPWFDKDIFVPQLRVDRQYASAVSDGETFDPAQDAIVSDTFVDRAYRDPTGKIERGWCHGTSFNVLMGHGAVRLARPRRDTGPPGTTMPVEDGMYNASCAEQTWNFFTEAGK